MANKNIACNQGCSAAEACKSEWHVAQSTERDSGWACPTLSQEPENTGQSCAEVKHEEPKTQRGWLTACPYKDPERKRKWEREHREQRNARRRALRLTAETVFTPKAALDPLLNQQPTSGWKVICRSGGRVRNRYSLGARRGAFPADSGLQSDRGTDLLIHGPARKARGINSEKDYFPTLHGRNREPLRTVSPLLRWRR